MAIFLFLTVHSLIFPEDETLERARLEVLKDPGNPTPHFRLGKIFLERNDFNVAKEEFRLAEIFSKKETWEENVLGATSPPLALLKKAMEAPEEIAAEISFWEKIVKEKPDYRDAYLRLAVLNYQLHKKEEAREYLKKVIDLDPNFEPARELGEIISSK